MGRKGKRQEAEELKREADFVHTCEGYAFNCAGNNF